MPSGPGAEGKGGVTGVELVALGALLAWLLLLLDGARRWPADCRLGAAAEGADADETEVAVIVAARNEAELLPRTLPSLLGQEGRRSPVFLVDDGSSDGTGDCARRIARALGADDRLVVIEVGRVPSGWTGKVHALHRGIQAAAGREPEWLLLTDADIRHRPDSIGALLEQARSTAAGGPFDLVSVMARLHAESGWERLLAPPFVFFFHLLYPFRRVARSASRVAAAAGGCVLVRRSLLARAGGLRAIRGAVIDDVALARLVKSAGGSLWLGFDPDIQSLRRYPRLRDFWCMVSRSAFAQLGYRWSLLPPTLVALAALVISPPWVIGTSLSGLFLGSEAAPSLVRALLWGASTWILQARALLPAVLHHRVARRFAWGLPLAGALFAAMTVASAARHLAGRQPRWRDRPSGAT